VEEVFNNNIMLACSLKNVNGSILSPMLLLSAYCDFCGVELPERIEVLRKDIGFL
jgi:hypothetical protein